MKGKFENFFLKIQYLEEGKDEAERKNRELKDDIRKIYVEYESEIKSVIEENERLREVNTRLTLDAMRHDNQMKAYANTAKELDETKKQLAQKEIQEKKME